MADKTPDENNWKRNLSLLHRRTPYRTPDKDNRKNKDKENTRTGLLTDSSVKSSTRDKELDSLAMVDPAMTLFGSGSTPSSHISSMNHNRSTVSIYDDFINQSTEAALDTSLSGVRNSQQYQQRAPVWDSSLFLPSPSPMSTSFTSGGGASHLTQVVSTPSGGIIDIDFRRHGRRPSTNSDESGPSGKVIHSSTKQNDKKARDNSDSCYGDDDVMVVVMTPTRHQDDSFGSGNDSHTVDSCNSCNDDFVSGDSKSSNSEPAETSFNIDDGRALFQSSIVSEMDAVIGVSEDVSSVSSKRVNQMLNFGSSVEDMSSMVMHGGQNFDSSTSLLSNVSSTISQSSFSNNSKSQGGSGGGSDNVVDCEDGVSTTETIRVVKDHSKGRRRSGTSVDVRSHSNNNDYDTPPKHSHGVTSEGIVMPKSDVSPESTVLKNGEHASELKNVTKKLNKPTFTAAGVKEEIKSGSSEPVSEVSPTKDRKDSEFAKQLETFALKCGEKSGADDQPLLAQSDENTKSKSQNVDKIEQTPHTPSLTPSQHVKPDIVPESPFIESGVALASHNVTRKTPLPTSDNKNISALPAGDMGDEWKTATTTQGKTYYYNRRTRVSAWKLPSNAIYVRSGESTFRIFVPPASKTVGEKTNVDREAGIEPRAKLVHSEQSTTSPSLMFNTPPRVMRQQARKDADSSVLTTPPRRRSSNSNTVTSHTHKTTNYSPTRGLMATPPSHNQSRKPTSASPGVAFLKRHNQNRPIDGNDIHMSSTVPEKSSTKKDHVASPAVLSRSLINPAPLENVPPDVDLNTLTETDSKEKNSTPVHDGLKSDSFDALEQRVVLNNGSHCGDALTATRTQLQMAKSDVTDSYGDSFASDRTAHQQLDQPSTNFGEENDLHLFCPLCGGSVLNSVKNMSLDPETGTTMLLPNQNAAQFTPIPFMNHMLECTSGKSQLKNMRKVLQLLHAAVDDTILKIDGVYGDVKDEKPLPCSSISIEKGDCTLPAGQSPSIRQPTQHNASPHPETSLDSQDSSVIIADQDQTFPHEGKRSYNNNVDTPSQRMLGESGAYIRHHPRGELEMPTGVKSAGTTYTELYHRSHSPNSSSARSRAVTPPSKVNKAEREILSGVSGVKDTAPNVSNNASTPQEKSHTISYSAVKTRSFATPPSAAVKHPPVQSCGKEPSSYRVFDRGTDEVQSRPQFICPCCQMSDLDSREELLSHMRTCMTFTDSSNKIRTDDGNKKFENNIKLDADHKAHGNQGERNASKDSFGGHGHAKAVCPFCGKPSTKSALSAHLLGCQKRKASQERRTNPSKVLLSQSQKETLPAYTSPAKSGRKRTPLTNRTNYQKSPLTPRKIDDTSSTISASTHHSQSSRLSSLSQASTVANQRNNKYTSPVTRRMHDAIQASRQQTYKNSSRTPRGTSPYKQSNTSTLSRRVNQRPILAPFR